MGNSKLIFTRNIRQVAGLFYLSLRRQVRDEWLGSYFPSKPTFLNLLANDICNSHCLMCNIWQRQPETEIAIEELRRILVDPLFRQIQFVDITGGEPTLRPDLPEIGRVFVESLPKLTSLRIITNAIDSDVVIERTLALAQVTQAAGIPLSVSISLDGVGDDHDRNRGVPGNFLSAVEVIHLLKQNGLPLSISCTLTPQNCQGADDVIRWCEQNGIREWKFRLGVDIRRFYNEGFSQQNQYTPEERFHVIMFFDKLARYRGVDLARRTFYKSLVGQLAFGLPRRVGCDWQARAIALDMRGNISFCPAQSPILDHAISKSAWQVYKKGILERQRIIHEHCGTCQHDVPGQLSTVELVRRGADIISSQSQQRRKSRRNWSSLTKSILPADLNSPHKWRRVLITGWFGTETAGDKAILGEVLHFIKACSPGCHVTLTTIDRKVSQQTNLELVDLRGADLVDMAKGHDPALIESVDAVIIGGGPLMEVFQMEYIWRMFAEANRQRKARIVFGCGVGPLYSDRMRQITNGIFQMTTAGFLRDVESYEYAVKIAPAGSLSYACDPALAYLKRWLIDQNRQLSRGHLPLRIAGLLRANTNEFVLDQTKTELEDFNVKAAQQIAQILEIACKASRSEVHLLPMNVPWIGGDDRMFNRQVAGFFNDPGVVQVEQRYLPLEALLQSLYLADAALAMRYHGHLFCMTLGIPFLSIDYTGGQGKVHRLIQRIGYGQWSEEWGNIDTRRAADRLLTLFEERAFWSVYLQQQAEILVAELNRTYTQVFQVSEV